jgi:DNA topoisomerase-1
VPARPVPLRHAEPAPPGPGLRHSSDAEPGLRRVRRGRGFSYLDAAGRPVRDERTLARIRSLAIPPAWTHVWICRDARGHLQATGRDVRGRRQPRYHPRWRAVRDEAKFARLPDFARALPRIRARVSADLADETLSRRRVVATVVRLLETTLARVGNDEYARDNRSFGLTTLRDGHATARGGGVRLRFRGKSGKEHDADVTDPRVAKVVLGCQDLPGQRLFQYVDRGRRRPVGSADVNRYLREASGMRFTAKDFRTWAATVLAIRHLEALPLPASAAAARRAANRAIDGVAERLRNTRAVCRASYVHPAVVEAALDRTFWARVRRCAGQGRCPRGLRRDEAKALLFLAGAPTRAEAARAAARAAA